MDSSLRRPLDGDLAALVAASGAFGFAVVAAEPVAEEARRVYDSFIARGHHGPLRYLENWRTVRDNPQLLIEETDGGPAQSLIMALFAYPHPSQAVTSHPRVAHFAQAPVDYHTVIKQRLMPVAEAIGRRYDAATRVVTDSAPLRERYWAERAGLGRVTRNNHLTVPGYGANFHIAAIVTAAALTPTAVTPLPDPCPPGCRRCVDVCPTGALRADGSCDAGRCLSTLTIENARANTRPVRGVYIFGCDLCRLACPLTAQGQAAPTVTELTPSPELRQLLPSLDWRALTGGGFRRLFGQSCLRRCGLSGLRNTLSKMKQSESSEYSENSESSPHPTHQTP